MSCQVDMICGGSQVSDVLRLEESRSRCNYLTFNNIINFQQCRAPQCLCSHRRVIICCPFPQKIRREVYTNWREESRNSIHPGVAHAKGTCLTGLAKIREGEWKVDSVLVLCFVSLTASLFLSQKVKALSIVPKERVQSLLGCTGWTRRCWVLNRNAE